MVSFNQRDLILFNDILILVQYENVQMWKLFWMYSHWNLNKSCDLNQSVFIGDSLYRLIDPTNIYWDLKNRCFNSFLIHLTFLLYKNRKRKLKTSIEDKKQMWTTINYSKRNIDWILQLDIQYWLLTDIELPLYTDVTN